MKSRKPKQTKPVYEMWECPTLLEWICKKIGRDLKENWFVYLLFIIGSIIAYMAGLTAGG
jgi:hypothetical protein